MSYLPNHQQEGAPTTPRHPSGLFSALDKVGRVRGSSATPPPPIPAKNPERAQIEQELLQRLRDMPSHEDYSMNTGKLPAGVLCSLHTRNSSDETEVSEGGGVLISTQKPPSVNELAIEFQGRLNGLIDRIRSTNIPSLAQTLLINEVQSIGKDFRDREKRLKEEIDHITSERNNLANRLREIARQLRIATAERDKNRNDYQDLFLGMEDLKTKARKSEAALAEAKGQFAQEIEQLNMKLKHQDEQLKGKRALWLNSNPGSSARRSAMTAIRDPFESPSAPSASFNSINTSFGSGNMGNILSPKSTTPYTSFDSQTSSGSAPPKMNMRAASTPQKLRSRGPIHGGTPSGMPSGGTLSERMRKSHLRGPSQNIRNPLFTAGYGDTPTNPNYDPNFKPSLASLDISGRALELYVEEGGSDLAPEFREVLGHLYIVIEGWAREYANIPQPENDQEVIKNNPDAWEFIMNCTYPAKRQDAHVHAVALMNDRTSRFWFIMRIMCQHIFLNMVTMKGWYGFSEECDAKLDVLRKKFSERGLQNEARQKLVDQRVAVIKEIMDGINFQDWRSEQLNHHTQVLRTIVSQFLNYDCDRLVAGRDLGLLTIEAWEVSTKMNATPVSFQVLFPETNGKFSSTSMMAKDRQDVDSMELQLRQTRLKLVITPVITLRDDRGTTMKAKSLLLSTVLCMQ